MITKITGLPGNGKTLYTLNLVEAERKGRPVYYHGIAELRLDWSQLDDSRDWWKVPDGSIVVIDEAQKTFPPRAVGSQVPQHVSEFETHRHRGLDVYLITQHPMLVDSAVRRLTQRHFHCVRKFGFEAATIHEWPTGVNNECEKNRADAIRHDFKFPKASYGWYKSAEVHTVKRRIPKRVWFLGAAPLLVVGLVWYAWSALSAHAPVSVDAPRPGAAVAVQEQGGRGHVKTTKEYLADYSPRLPGLAFTAPAYDRVTEPSRAPFPAACVASKDRCKCFSQQGTGLDVPEGLCRDVVAKGYFKPWDEQEKMQADRPERQPVRLDAAAPRDGDRYVALSGGVAPRGNAWGDLRTFSTSKTEGQK